VTRWDPIRRVAFLVLVALATTLVPDRSALAVKDDPECLRWRRAFAGMPEGTLVIHASAGRRLRIPAKVARTDEARWAGFQCATPDEIRTTVIVFDFQSEVLGAFHMQNVAAPLDIAFVKGSGRILSILRMEPSPTATYGPMGAYRYAIEARAGFFKERGVSGGDEVRLDPR
jgi:uncharacterized membrane protein (UPF0127 family)